MRKGELLKVACMTLAKNSALCYIRSISNKGVASSSKKAATLFRHHGNHFPGICS